LTACGTGFRASELASLLPESFDLTAEPPTATVAAAYTKNKRLAVQPLPPDVAEALRGYLAGRTPGQPVWPGTWADDAADMLRIDLETAGVPYSVEGPDGPLYADFHALRHSYVALLDRAGLTLKMAMQLARHSDPKLTMARYGRAALCDLGAAVEALPGLLPTPPQQLAATGTDGELSTSEGVSLRSACASDEGQCGFPRTIDDSLVGENGANSERNSLEMKVVKDDCGEVRRTEESAPCRTRTYNPLIKSLRRGLLQAIEDYDEKAEVLKTTVLPPFRLHRCSPRAVLAVEGLLRDS
jgi:hypothetical protein